LTEALVDPVVEQTDELGKSALLLEHIVRQRLRMEHTAEQLLSELHRLRDRLEALEAFLPSDQEEPP
jgi:hypothetical protein